MERITRRSMKTLDAKDDKNGGSAPPTAGHGMYPPPAQASVYRKRVVIDCLEMEDFLSDPTLLLTDDCDWDDFDEERREGRQTGARKFRSEYTYGSVKDGCDNSMEQRTCIWPGRTFSWQDKSSGIMWVGVHGMDSICVVTRSEDLDPTRLCGSLKQLLIHEILFQFRKSVIVEIEDLADPSSEIRERFHKKIKKPFGVVSVIPGAYKSRKGRGREASSVEYGETKAVELLREKVKSGRVNTVMETIQAAIAAFGHLFQKKFKADEIQVSVMDPNYTVSTFEEDKDPSVEDLEIRQINEHLAVINKPGPPSKRKKTQVPVLEGSGKLKLQQHIICGN